MLTRTFIVWKVRRRYLQLVSCLLVSFKLIIKECAQDFPKMSKISLKSYLWWGPVANFKAMIFLLRSVLEANDAHSW